MNQFVCFSVINCTTLMVDSSGSLRMNSCGNYYGARCEFSCANGYRLNGSSDVTCVAPGDRPPGIWDNPVPSCQSRWSLSIYAVESCGKKSLNFKLEGFFSY